MHREWERSCEETNVEKLGEHGLITKSWQGLDFDVIAALTDEWRIAHSLAQSRIYETDSMT
jgi:hypothetical protein